MSFISLDKVPIRWNNNASSENPDNLTKPQIDESDVKSAPEYEEKTTWIVPFTKNRPNTEPESEEEEDFIIVHHDELRHHSILSSTSETCDPLVQFTVLPSMRLKYRQPGEFLRQIDELFRKQTIDHLQKLKEAYDRDRRCVTKYSLSELFVKAVNGMYSGSMIGIAKNSSAVHPNLLWYAGFGALFYTGCSIIGMYQKNPETLNLITEIYQSELGLSLTLLEEAGKKIEIINKDLESTEDKNRKRFLVEERDQVTALRDYFSTQLLRSSKESSIKGNCERIFAILHTQTVPKAKKL